MIIFVFFLSFYFSYVIVTCRHRPPPPAQVLERAGEAGAGAVAALAGARPRDWAAAAAAHFLALKVRWDNGEVTQPPQPPQPPPGHASPAYVHPSKAFPMVS